MNNLFHRKLKNDKAQLDSTLLEINQANSLREIGNWKTMKQEF